MGSKFFNRGSIGLRLMMIGILILILLIPKAMIGGLIQERHHRQAEVIAEVNSRWAQAQTVAGPLLTIPFSEFRKDEQGKSQVFTNYIQVLPGLLEIQGELLPEIRHRGIYRTVVYHVDLELRGDFSLNKVGGLGINPEAIHWNQAFVSWAISDLRGIKSQLELDWDGQKLLLEPGVRPGNNLFESGVSAPLSLRQGNHHFLLKLSLNGSERLNFIPLGQKTTLKLNSAWNSPSFTGAFLPEKPRLDATGFQANWQVLDLNRNYPQQWTGQINPANLSHSEFGVELFSPVDQYTKSDRAIKYLVLFVGLTFLVFFLMEIFSQKRIHPIQYLLIGLTFCLFYLLLLSLSEHLGFGWAYLIASLSVIGLITAYVRSALQSKTVARITAGLLVALYGFLYLLLQIEDYALLVGSIGLFAIMAAVMYLSRRIDWYQIELKN